MSYPSGKVEQANVRRRKSTDAEKLADILDKAITYHGLDAVLTSLAFQCVMRSERCKNDGLPTMARIYNRMQSDLQGVALRLQKGDTK